MRIILLSFIVIICSLIFVETQVHHDHHQYKQHHVLQIHKTNSADVYIIAQFIACLFSYSRFKEKLANVVTTPLGILADRIYVQEIHDHILFWNKITGRNLFIIKHEKLNEVYRDLDITVKMNHINLECVFNELIGVNNVYLTSVSNDMFKYLGNVLAEILGVGGTACGLFNLNGVLLIRPTFARRNTGITEKTPLKELYLIRNGPELAIDLARESLIVDASAYWSSKYLFQECSVIVTTCSGHKVGSLIGNVDLIKILEEATTSLLSTLKPDAILKLFSQVFQSIALDCNIGIQFSVLFGDPAPNPHATALCHGAHTEHEDSTHEAEPLITG